MASIYDQHKIVRRKQLSVEHSIGRCTLITDTPSRLSATWGFFIFQPKENIFTSILQNLSGGSSYLWNIVLVDAP